MLTEIDARQRLISKVTSIIVGAIGLYIIWGIWWGIIARHQFDSFLDVVFLLIFPIPAILLAVYFLYVAIKIWQDLSYKTACSLSSVISIILALLLLSIIDKFKPTALESIDSIWSHIQVLILMIAAGLFYIALKKFLLKWLCVKEEFDYYKHKKETKLYFGFLAFFIWMAISSTVELLPRDPLYEHSPDNSLLGSLITFGSIAIAYLFYRISLKLFLKKQPEPPKLAEKALENFKD